MELVVLYRRLFMIANTSGRLTHHPRLTLACFITCVAHSLGNPDSPSGELMVIRDSLART